METTISSNHFLQTLPVSIPSHVNQKKLVIVQTTDGGSLNGRQRRMMKNERREQLKASRQLWREQIDDKILEYEDRKRKQAKRRGYEMDVNMLSAKGSQWWLVFVPKDAEAVVAKNLAGALSASFPGRECDVGSQFPLLVALQLALSIYDAHSHARMMWQRVLSVSESDDAHLTLVNRQ
eukprot:c25026_g1_i4 orf=122-658(+)